MMKSEPEGEREPCLAFGLDHGVAMGTLSKLDMQRRTGLEAGMDKMDLRYFWVIKWVVEFIPCLAHSRCLMNTCQMNILT